MNIKLVFHLQIVLILLIGVSCTDKKEFSISGNIKNGAGETINLYELNAEETILIDSIKIGKDGKFKMVSTIESPTFFRLNASEKDFIFLVVEPGEEPELTADFNNLASSYKISGSYGSLILRKYMKQFHFSYKEKIRIADQYRRRIESGEDMEKVKKESIEMHNKMKSSIKEYTKSFIEENKCMLASVFILDLQLGPKDPILTMNGDYEYFAMVDSCLSEKHPEQELVQAFNKALVRHDEEEKLTLNKELNLGQSAPEVALPDTTGDTLLLSSLRGDYVLLSFWASWNKSSVAQNKELLEIYKNYNKSGFEIYQVSLDRSKEAWKNAIEKGNLPWINVSDLKFWDTYVVNLYKVYNLPANYLINPKGDIIDFNVEPNVLDEKLNSILLN